jgi:hypothetical protein
VELGHRRTLTTSTPRRQSPRTTAPTVGPALVLEQVAPFRACSRSIELTRGNLRDTFLACFCFFGVLGVINVATTAVGMSPLLDAIVQLVVGVVLASLQAVFVACLYAALRDREAAR